MDEFEPCETLLDEIASDMASECYRESVMTLDPEEEEEEEEIDDYDPWDDDMYAGDGYYFANAGSSLRAESESNPRNLPCGTCGAENVLTPADRSRGYQCDSCANRAERGW